VTKSHRRRVSGGHIAPEEGLRRPHRTGGGSPVTNSHRRRVSGDQITPKEGLRRPHRRLGYMTAARSAFLLLISERWVERGDV
jgi:hypothetical protein